MAQVRGRYLAPLFVAEVAVRLAQRLPGLVGSSRSDVTWLERNFVPMLDDVSALLKEPVVVDIDDAIWLYNPFGRSTVGRLLRRAEAVIAGNDFLGDWCSNYCSSVHIIPTAVDAERFCPTTRLSDEQGVYTIGWTGTYGNAQYLKGIEPALATFLESSVGTRLLIVADRCPELPSVPRDRIVFRPWSPAAEHEYVQQMDVGIMPLADSELARGKCSFKMLQYMACGIPAIVSPVGMNLTVLGSGQVGLGPRSIDDWVNAFRFYWRKPELRRQHGSAGRSIVLRDYDLQVIGNRIADTFEEL